MHPDVILRTSTRAPNVDVALQNNGARRLRLIEAAQSAQAQLAQTVFKTVAFVRSAILPARSLPGVEAGTSDEGVSYE